MIIRENALQALAYLTAYPPSDALREQILADNFAASGQAKLAWPTLSAYEDISGVVENIAAPTLIFWREPGQAGSFRATPA